MAAGTGGAERQRGQPEPRGQAVRRGQPELRGQRGRRGALARAALLPAVASAEREVGGLSAESFKCGVGRPGACE